MAKPIKNEIISDINNISRFLSKRDLRGLTSEDLSDIWGITQVDLLIILGNSMPDIALWGAEAYLQGLTKDIMLVGGIGHSTKYLVQNVLNDNRFREIETIDKPEADIFKQIIIKCYDINENQIITENQSGNCGSNAEEALRVLKTLGKVPETLLIMQDPTMQLRTYASFQKYWSEENTFIFSYSPFIPQVKDAINGFEFLNKEIAGLWTMERFIELLMGEIPRLRDDKSGYGPSGKGFIAHVDIPYDVLKSHERLLAYYNEYSEIKIRK